MVPDRKPALLFVGNPQTSKNESLPKTDLLTNPTFARVVSEFDQALGLPFAGSLQPEKQIASVVMSVASHSAFVHGLSQELQPGIVDSSRPFNTLFTGHCIGEMGALIEAGVCSISTMAWMLEQREKITQDPARAGVRHLVAVVGADPDKLEASLEQLGHEASCFVANFNTPKQAVVGLQIFGELNAGLEGFRARLQELKDGAGDLIFPKVRLRHLLPNAFHTMLMRAEEGLYVDAIAPYLNPGNFKRPKKETVYSPTKPGWVNSLGDAYDVVSHILTKPVRFTQAMELMQARRDLVAVVTADIVNTTPNLVLDNGLRSPILNITDLQSLKESIEHARQIVSSSKK